MLPAISASAKPVVSVLSMFLLPLSLIAGSDTRTAQRSSSIVRAGRLDWRKRSTSSYVGLKEIDILIRRFRCGAPRGPSSSERSLSAWLFPGWHFQCCTARAVNSDRFRKSRRHDPARRMHRQLLYLGIEARSRRISTASPKYSGFLSLPPVASPSQTFRSPARSPDPRERSMNHSLQSADRNTHLKIVVVALIAAFVVILLGLNARVGDTASMTVRNQTDGPVLKAGQPATYTGL